MGNMTQEDKELLLKDLCARLPYGVKIQVPYEDGSGYFDETVWEVNNEGPFHVNGWGIEYEYVKPYLFPLSSMTDEEKEELKQEHIKDEKLYIECLTMAAKGDSSMRGKVIIHYAMDWCNANHFDYRGLIEKGLAIDATGLNIY